MKLILKTTSTKYYLTTSRKYYHANKNKDEELIVLQDNMGCLPDSVYTLSCAERVKIIQHDAEGNRIIVGYNHTMNPFTLTRVTCRF